MVVITRKRRNLSSPISFLSVATTSQQPSVDTDTDTHQPSAISHQPPLITYQPPAITHQPSLISHHSSAISHRSSLITHQPSLITHHSSATSLISHHSSRTHHSSLIAHQSSVITRHLSLMLSCIMHQHSPSVLYSLEGGDMPTVSSGLGRV